MTERAVDFLNKEGAKSPVMEHQDMLAECARFLRILGCNREVQVNIPPDIHRRLGGAKGEHDHPPSFI